MTKHGVKPIRGIYAILWLPQGWLYVGRSSDFRKRWGDHRSALVEGRHSSKLLQTTFVETGRREEDFFITLLKAVPRGDLKRAEARSCPIAWCSSDGWAG